MPSSPLHRLGELERAVLEHIWSSPEAVSVRMVHEAVREQRALAYTTVLTVMTRLVTKGLLTRHRDGRAYLYAATDTRERHTAFSIRDHLDRLQPGHRREALRHFLEGASDEELADVRAGLAAIDARDTATQ